MWLIARAIMILPDDWKNLEDTAVDDRRTNERLTLMKTIHISCFDSRLPQETATVVDISREGLYITARERHYRVGLEIRATIPSLGFQGVCRVVRIEEL